MRADLPSVRQWANQAFSRASGTPLREGNGVTLLKDASENYPAWLNAIRGAQRTIHFEMYILHEDDQGQLFADALLQKASEGVRVRLLYDWMGGFGKTSMAFSRPGELWRIRRPADPRAVAPTRGVGSPFKQSAPTDRLVIVAAIIDVRNAYRLALAGLAVTTIATAARSVIREL